MKSFVRNFPQTWVRRVHLGWELPRLAKISENSDVPAAKKEEKKQQQQQQAAEKPSQMVAFHRDVPSKYTQLPKVSAAVRASLLSKEDTQSTLLEPEELRDPAEAMAAFSLAPKRSELDQRKARKTQCANQLQALILQKTSSSAQTVQCVPFVKVKAQGSGSRSCDTAEDLLSQERDPTWLAEAFIKLKGVLRAEQERIMAMTESYLELKAELYAKNLELKALTQGRQT